jgi:hypothetical protein
MAILLVSKGTPVHGTGTLTPGSPASIVVGNWLVSYFAEYQGSSAQPSTPANWTLISDTTGNHSGVVYARIADGTANDAMPSINYGSAVDQMAYCEQWSGLPATIAGNVTATSRQANLTSGCQSGAITPPVNGCLIIGFMCRNKTSTSDGATWGNWTVGGQTFTQNNSGVPTTNKLMWLAESLVQTTATAISTGTSNNSSPADSTAQSTAGFTIVIQPPSASAIPFPPTSLGGMNVQVCM